MADVIKINGYDVKDATARSEVQLKYTKPSTGIPSSDMATAVVTSLGKADTAYQKPSTGIPSSDMSTAVQTSLGKADSALQSVPSTYRTAAAQDTIDSGKLATSLKGAANGVAELDSNGKVPTSQLPSYVDDVEAYASQSNFPTTGEDGKIYIAKDTNLQYRWDGSAYAVISPTIALGETSSTAYYGDKGKIAYEHSQDATVHVTSSQKTEWSSKQDAISDLADIRSNASAGAAKVSCTDATVGGFGYTKNAGTITGITMNGSSQGTSGVVDLGTVITAHQDISGKQDTISDLATIRSNAAAVSGKETKGKMTVGSTEYTIAIKQLVLTDASGTTETYNVLVATS